MTEDCHEPTETSALRPAIPLIAAGLLGFALAGAARGEPPAGEASGLNGLIRALVLQNIPREYENTKQWGGTKRVWDGLHISRDGLRIKTKRRWKEARDGTWKRYRAWLIDPENQFDIRLTNLRQTPDGKAAGDVIVDARLGADGRLSEWVRDVQLYSFSVQAEAKVRLRLDCRLSAELDYGKLPPDVVLQPTVRDAQLTLIDFRLQRISDADGPLVKQLGKALREVLEDELRERRVKLVQKINRQIDKHADDLRLSAHDLAVGGWQKVLALLNVDAAAAAGS